jgi:putative hydrolase of the HAD superfamily
VFYQILKKYGLSLDDLQTENELEVENIQYYGYGVMSFVLSLIEMAIKLTGKRIHSSDIQQLLDLGKTMLTTKVEIFSGVPSLLDNLSTRYSLMLITKGDIFHQQRKLKSSGLERYFSAVEYVSEKKSDVYQSILKRHQIDPTHFLMIGNSLRSDILPVLDLGGWAVHISGHLTWSHENDTLKDFPSEKFAVVEGIHEILSTVNGIERQGD